MCCLSLSPLILIISTHPFSIASLLISCNICPLFLFVFHLSLPPLILYHLYSSLHKSHPYFLLETSFLCFFSYVICLCLLSFSIISTHHFSIASLPFSCNIFPLILFGVSFVSVSSYSLLSLLIPSQSHPYLFLVTSFLVSFRVSFVSVSSHSLLSLLIPSHSHPYLFPVTSFLVSFRVSFVSVSSHSLSSLLIPSQSHSFSCCFLFAL